MNKKTFLYILIGLLIVSNAWVWQETLRLQSAPDLKVYFFDVGQGDAELIESKDGRQILIDGGPGSMILSRLGEVIPFGDHSIDAIIISHPHADHIAGLIDVVDRYDVGMIFESGAEYSSTEFFALEELIDKKHIPRVLVDASTSITFADGARFSFLAPSASFAHQAPKHIHDAMVVGSLNYQGKTVVFMGDAEKKIEQRMLADGIAGPVSILKVGHHGSKTSSSGELVAALRPALAVISVGKNKYGHPNAAVLERLVTHGAMVLRTDRVGTVEVDFTSRSLLIAPYRGAGGDGWQEIK